MSKLVELEEGEDINPNGKNITAEVQGISDSVNLKGVGDSKIFENKSESQVTGKTNSGITNY